MARPRRRLRRPAPRRPASTEASDPVDRSTSRPERKPPRAEPNPPTEPRMLSTMGRPLGSRRQTAPMEPRHVLDRYPSEGSQVSVAAFLSDLANSNGSIVVLSSSSKTRRSPGGFVCRRSRALCPDLQVLCWPHPISDGQTCGCGPWDVSFPTRHSGRVEGPCR